VFLKGGQQLGMCLEVSDFAFPMPLADALSFADAGPAMRTWGDVLREDVRVLQSGGDSLVGRCLGAFGVSAKAKKGGQLLRQSCGEMFSDRTELASCAWSAQASSDAGTVKIADFALHFYSSDALNGDTALHACLKLDGSWSALSHDSHEYKREKIRESLERLEKIQSQVAAP
jgi:hypothetical protein